MNQQLCHTTALWLNQVNEALVYSEIFGWETSRA